MTPHQPTALIAIGGNSLITDPLRPEVENQWDAVRETCRHISDLVERGWNTIVTHGNGPQVGFILRRAELAMHEVHPVPLDLIGADTQGSIGYMVQQALGNEFRLRNISRQAVTIVTQVMVDRDDPGFKNPSKPIGGFMTQDEAKKFEAMGWTIVEDAGRGYRRVIASPKPIEIIEVEAITTMLAAGWVVIAVGGGGIPVIRNSSGELRGAPPAVIDKDLASALMATRAQADLFVISTGVEKVAIHFNKPNQQWLDRMTSSEARQYLAEGHFAAGSMKPKIEAILSYLDGGGKEALITDPSNIARALAGETGTHIYPD